mmetsp:Transcript_7488/g.10542  ORF Transcript_7488/g.10542 Transcript_7488/m.10542 type:complete len:620 (+) Transcript_7488:127-1986(+)
MQRRPPKRPRSGYNFFQLSFLTEGSKIRHTQHAAKEISKSWRQLSAEEKQPFMAMADFDHQRYMKECQQFEVSVNQGPQDLSSFGLEGSHQVGMMGSIGLGHSAEVHNTSIENNWDNRIKQENRNVIFHMPIRHQVQAPKYHFQHQNESLPIDVLETHHKTHHQAHDQSRNYPPHMGGGHHNQNDHSDQRSISMVCRMAETSDNGLKQELKQQQQQKQKQDQQINAMPRVLGLKMGSKALQDKLGENEKSKSKVEQLLPPYLRSPQQLLTTARSFRMNELHELENGQKQNLAQIENLIREINLCDEQLGRDEDTFEALVLNINGSKKMRMANIPSIFVSFTALSLYPIKELIGTVFEVELCWKRRDIRCTTRALLAVGAPSRAELVLGTLNAFPARTGMKVSIKFLRYIRQKEKFTDNHVTTKNQIMLDLWSMGLQIGEHKYAVPNLEKTDEKNIKRGESENTDMIGKIQKSKKRRADGNLSGISPIPKMHLPLFDNQFLMRFAKNANMKLGETPSQGKSLINEIDEANRASPRPEHNKRSKIKEDLALKTETGPCENNDPSQFSGTSFIPSDLKFFQETEKNKESKCIRCAHCAKDLDQASIVCHDEITTDVCYCSER